MKNNLVNVKIVSCEGISKVGNIYDYSIITISSDDLEITIKDYTYYVPKGAIYEGKDEIIIDDKGRYKLKNLDYYISWKYKLAINMFINSINA